MVISPVCAGTRPPGPAAGSLMDLLSPPTKKLPCSFNVSGPAICASPRSGASRPITDPATESPARFMLFAHREGCDRPQVYQFGGGATGSGFDPHAIRCEGHRSSIVGRDGRLDLRASGLDGGREMTEQHRADPSALHQRSDRVGRSV